MLRSYWVFSLLLSLLPEDKWRGSNNLAEGQEVSGTKCRPSAGGVAFDMYHQMLADDAVMLCLLGLIWSQCSKDYLALDYWICHAKPLNGNFISAGCFPPTLCLKCFASNIASNEKLRLRSGCARNSGKKPAIDLRISKQLSNSKERNGIRAICNDTPFCSSKI